MANAILFNGGGVGAESAAYTANAEHVLDGYRYIGADTNDEVGTGTMTNNGAQNNTVDFGEKITIAKGYHNGQGVITASKLTSCWADPNYVASGGDLTTHYYCTVHTDGKVTTRSNSSDTRHTACDLTPKRTFYVCLMAKSGGYTTITWKFVVPENMNFKDLFGRSYDYGPLWNTYSSTGQLSTTHTSGAYYEIPTYAYPTGVVAEGGLQWYQPRFIPSFRSLATYCVHLYVSSSDTTDYLSIYNGNLTVTHQSNYHTRYLYTNKDLTTGGIVKDDAYPAEGQTFYALGG